MNFLSLIMALLSIVISIAVLYNFYKAEKTKKTPSKDKSSKSDNQKK
jgi:hypothetical protein